MQVSILGLLRSVAGRAPRDPVVVIPECGLGNRLLVLACAFAHSKRFGRPFQVLWKPTRALAARWQDLFAAQPFTSFRGDRFPSNVFLEQKLCHACNTLKRLGIERGQIVERRNHVWRGAWRTSDSAYLSCWQDVSPDNASFQSFFRALRPSQAVSARLDPLRDWFDRDVVGIHFRGTDAFRATNARNFDSLLREVSAYHSSTRFFVASDASEEKRRLLDALGNRATCQKLEFPGADTPKQWKARKRVAGMQEAAADLFALSQCKAVVCNTHSTFSACASHMGGIPWTDVSEGRSA